MILSTVLALHSSSSSKLSWLRPALSNLLSIQLLRPGGVTSLLICVVGDDEEVGVKKLDMLSRLLRTPSRDQPESVRTIQPLFLSSVAIDPYLLAL